MASTKFLSTIFCCFLISLAFGEEECTHDPDSRCFDATCGMQIYDDKIGTPCICNEDDIGEQFTDCLSDNTRTLMYFWKPPAVCLNGTLPYPVSGIPCNLYCTEGSYLNLDSMSCQDCPAGHYSAGGGEKWTDWNHFPGQFSTHCVRGGAGGTCNPWQFYGEYVDSGDNNAWHYLESVLDLKVHLVRAGYVRFEYAVSAEPGFDGLWFVVDDLGITFQSNKNWTLFTRYLNPGFHQFSWKYYKDYSVTRGLDRAFIRMIEVVGTTYAKTQCEECKPGYYINSTGSSECEPCPAGTYSNQVATTSCIPCDSDEYSYEGATACIKSRPCNDSSDYSYYFTDCVNNRNTKVYTWILPAACDTQRSTLPPNEEQSCTIPSCKPGQVPDPNNPNNCIYCNPGSVPSGSSCVTCQLGYAGSPRVAYFDKWSNELPSSAGNFTTGCNGNCMVDGWRLGQWFIDSGVGHGSGAFPWLRWTGEVLHSTTVTFNYSLPCKTGDVMQLWVDNQIMEEFECQGDCSSPYQTYTYRFHFDGHTNNKLVRMTWVLLKTSPPSDDHDCDRVMISDITITGIHEGEAGSTQCVACNAGTFSNQVGAHYCQHCAPGSSNPSTVGPSTSCTPCNGNTFADEYGQVFCLPCGANTNSTSDKTQCTFNCDHLVVNAESGRIYNLTSLGHWNLSYITSGVNGTLVEFDIFGSVCSWNSHCVDRIGNTLHSYVCLSNKYDEDNDGLQNFGKVVYMTETTDTVGLNLHYDSAGNCTTNLNLVCDTNSYSDPMWDPNLDLDTFESTCGLSIIWHTPYACPLCNEADIGVSEGECINSQKNRTFYWANSYCYGGMDLPPTETIECTEVKVNKRTIVIISTVAVVILAAAIGGVIYLYYRNKKLYAEYSKLKINNVPMDEDNFRITSLDDDEK